MEKQFICNKTEPVVETKAGKVRGIRYGTTYIFRGMDYAYADRFQPPQPVEPWEGVKDAFSYGYVCPLMHPEKPGSGELMVPHRYWPQNEHCQNLNVWTQTLDKNAGKPVMVWLHGGGFYAGSSIEQQAYDGDNMSKYGDVVVVSVNHRLNILGYFDLEPYGEKYKNSGNAGNADLVAALQWVHDNIENFGGDPENVTIFGQSGGGMKVFTLMQTPAADGLFQKGIIMSGVLFKGFVREDNWDSRPLIDGILNELGLTADEVETLETMPYEELVAAFEKVAPELQKQGMYTGSTPIPNGYYVGDPRTVGFTEHAKTIPVMIGSVFGEFAFGPATPVHNDLTEEEKLAVINKKYKKNAAELTRLFKEAWYDKDITCLTTLDSTFRAPTRDFIETKAACPESPTYSYIFAYDFPYDGGKTAWHCSDIPFAFRNTEMVPICNEVGVTEKLQENVFGAYIAFARNGDPSHSGLPTWKPCAPGCEPVMVFDRECTVRENFDKELIALHVQSVTPWPLPPDDDEEKVEIQH